MDNGANRSLIGVTRLTYPDSKFDITSHSSLETHFNFLVHARTPIFLYVTCEIKISPQTQTQTKLILKRRMFLYILDNP